VQCINLNIPDGDDAHMVFLPLPSEGSPTAEWIKKYEEVEQYFIAQVIQLTKSRVHTTLPRKFPSDPPQNIRTIMDELITEWYNGETNAHVQIKITNPHTLSSTLMETRWFEPIVVNNLRRTLKQQQKEKHEHTPLEGYEICFISKNDDVTTLMMVDHVLTSEDPYGESEDSEASMLFKGEHLTPLQDQLDESIRAATSVIRELNVMERREQRMRKTADSINWRVRNFSYLSIAVLILVTFFQVTYLKRYFRKKKLL
jgi:hypothetical protein